MAAKKRTIEKKNKLMKSSIPCWTIPVLAALVLVGCSQNSPSDSTNAQSTNSGMNSANGMSGGGMNTPATNSLPNLSTNMAASTNQ